jgi:hypothetical protein
MNSRTRSGAEIKFIATTVDVNAFGIASSHRAVKDVDAAVSRSSLRAYSFTIADF